MTTIDVTTAPAAAVTTGMRITVAGAAILIVVAIVIAVGSHARRQSVLSERTAITKALFTTPNRDDLLFLKRLVEVGELKPVIERRYPLSEVGNALRHVGGRRSQGQTVIQIASTPEHAAGV